MKTQPIFILFVLSSTALLAQKEYSFGSTGQQKLLINPAFCASSQGLELQTLAASYPYPKENTSTFVNYTGISYCTKKLSFGISNTYFNEVYSPSFADSNYYYNKRASNQTDLSVAYTIKLKAGITLVPAIQASYFTVNEYYKSTSFNATGGRISAGIIADIKNTFTFGVAFYDMNEKKTGYTSNRFLNGSQFYHASVFLLKDKKVTLQPYFILKTGHFDNNYYEEGAYISYKNISLQLGLKTFFTGFGKDYYFGQGQLTAVAGLNYTYKKIRFGYAFYYYSDPANEIFLSFNLFNKSNARQRSLMLN